MSLGILLKKIFDFFVFSSLFIACCAVLMVWQTCLLFDLPLSGVLLAFVFCGSVCSYNFHWFLTPPGNEAASQKLSWSIVNKPLHLALAIAGLVGAIVFAFFLREHWFWLGIIGIATFLYSAPMIPHPLFIMLRKVALGKTIYLAMVWTLITAFLPLAIQADAFTEMGIIFFFNRFFFIYAICILFDYRDVESDRKAGIRSLITYFNEAGINLLFWISLLIALITTVLLGMHFDWLTATALIIPIGILTLLYRKAKVDFSDYLYYFVLDGLMMASAPLLLLIKFAR